ncbi:hypothetical protein [Modestobacter sp. SYSU DS0875]
MSPRVALALAGLAALLLPAPELTVLGVGLTVAGLVALGAAVVAPGSTAPAVLIGVAALSWLAGGDAGAWGRLTALAFALAVVHATAALAAVTPRTARVPARLLLRWVGWAAGATAGGALAVAVAGLLPVPPAVPTTVAALVGLAAAGGALLSARAVRPAD